MSIEQQIIRESPEIEALKIQQMQEAKDLASGFSPYLIPETKVAGQTAGQLAAVDAALQQGVGAYQPYLTAATDYTQTAGGVTGEARGVGLGALGQYDPRMAYGFMDPYQQAVTDKVMSELDRQASIQATSDAAGAVRAGAFGGTREGVQRAETARNLQDVKARALADAYSRNFQQAQQAAMGSYEAAKGRQAGVAGLLGNVGQQYANLGQQYATLGQIGQGMSQGDISFLYNIGQQQQAQDQAVLDAARQTDLARTYAPFEMAGFVSDIYKGAPSSQMVSATKTSGGGGASPIQNLFGTAAGAYATGKGFGVI